ncbi:MAG TPA: peptide chain release factor N(5)-glutamine methyltransferase [Acidimicrobiales bacterium]|nr:peptide chain release factor N(5)-glutamine methyltransferase [Acidimicrobiales bacterium]
MRSSGAPVVAGGSADVERRLAALLGSAAEARWIADDVLGRPRPTGPVPPDARVAMEDMASRRLAGVPLQYVLGRWAFRTLELVVDERVLIPRPETEQVVEVALGELARVARSGAPPTVADLGTGSGAIALSVAAEAGGVAPGVSVSATDVSPDALEVAAANRRLLAATHPDAAARVVLAEGSWWDALPQDLAGRLGLVVANPPYVAVDEWPDLDAEVRAEPYGALVAAPGSDGTPGLAAVETIVRGAARWLTRGGAVVVEIAPHQSTAAQACARSAGFTRVEVRPDLAGRARVLVAGGS